jgi:hypothetical protein
LATLSGNALSIKSGVSTGTVTVQVTFPAYTSAAAAGINATVTVTIVDVAGNLTLSASPNSVLNMYQCTSAYQRLTVAASVTLTNLAQHTVTSFTTFSSNSSAASVAGAVASGVSPGAVRISGIFASLVTGATRIVVTNTYATVTGLTPGLVSTLSGYVGATSTVSLGVSLSDGTSIGNVVAQAAGLGFPLSSMIAFVSNDTARHTVSPAGVVALVGNSYLPTAIVAGTVCGPFVNSTSFIYGNLLPQPYDVDLGASSGPPFAPLVVGSSVDCARDDQLGGGNLLNFQISVTIDASLFQATSCSAGSAWSAYLFSCTLGSPPSVILIGGEHAQLDRQQRQCAGGHVHAQSHIFHSHHIVHRRQRRGAHHQRQRRRRCPVYHVRGQLAGGGQLGDYLSAGGWPAWRRRSSASPRSHL